jgi:hypothetical protein
MQANEPQNHLVDGNEPAQDPVLRQLGRADFSRAAFKSRAQLRQRLVDQAGLRQPGRSRRLVMAFEGVGLALLVFAFLFAVSRLAGSRTPIPGAPLPGALLTPTPATPAQTPPEPTKTISIDDLTATAAPGIGMSSTPDEVRLAITRSSWKTLWGELEIAYYANGNTDAPENRVYAQAYLENGGRALVLSSDKVPGQFNFNLDVSVRWVDIYKDGKHTTFDKLSGDQTQSEAVALFPLDDSPPMQLVFPDFLMLLSSSPSPLRMDEVNGRPALVADWGSNRLWVDTQTGLLLKAEQYADKPGESPLQSVLSFHQLLVDLPIPGEIFSPPHPNELAFQRPPSSEVVLQPTPTPWASESPQGWIYFQAVSSAPFEWEVYTLPASCLFQNRPCGNPWQLPGNPNLQITGLYFSPDHSLGIFTDTNHNQLVALDVKTRQWQPVVQGFFQPQLTWSPDGSRLAALTEGDGAYDMKLVTILRNDWKVYDVPTNLKGDKQVIGWLDEQTLVVDIPNISTFKGGTPDWVATDFHPGIYRINIETGQSDLLSVVDAKPFSLQLSPDGKQFVYWQWVQNRAVIYLSSPGGSDTQATPLEGHDPIFSPDGQWLLFRQTRAASDQQPQVDTLLVAHPDGSALQKVLESNGTLETAWSPDGKYLFVSEVNVDEQGTKNLYLYNLEEGLLNKIDLPSMTGAEVVNLLGWQP